MARADLAFSQWKKERPDLDAFPMMLFGRLLEAAELLDKTHLSPLYKKYNLQRGEFDVLATLRRSGEPYALSPTALYRMMMISSGGVTNRVDRLEKAGLVRRRRSPTDRRSVQVELTAEGLTRVDAMLTEHVERQRELIAHLSSEQKVELDSLLASLIRVLSNE
ncbi:MarR family winged helix-turn-helix transcriptional regulator [Salinisphaera sp. RV14]|uniref:MarR family winged helix-turn-helix transcriptional regulator n=1 Tax=unclassified Salinisphaera TaxID=2649847 RepID=UPI003F87CBF6